MYSLLKLCLVLLSIAFVAALTIPDADIVITVPLNKTLPSDNREIYGDFIKLNSTTTVKVNFTDVGPNLKFLILQSHTQIHTINMYQKNSTHNIVNQIYGSNLGLVSILRPEPDIITVDTFYIHNPNMNKTVLVYISVHAYEIADPIPGGCNQEFEVAIAPYMKVKTNEAYISVESAAPSIDFDCIVLNIATSRFYLMYLPELNFYMDDYFDGIRSMMSLKNINKYGRLIPETKWAQRRLLSAYPGTGVIFVAVASYVDSTNKTRNAIYVPTHSYGCIKMNENGCEISDDMLSQTFCAFLLFLGLFVSFFGHRFFKTEMFLCGFFSGFVITYILINLMEKTIETPALVAASALSGVFFGAIWLLFWWLYAIPVLAVSLVALNVGFIVASIFYYSLPVAKLYLQDDLNFWLLFFIVMVLTALALVSVTYAGNIMCCAALGGFATLYAFDYFVGSNLKYIMINIVRRAVVPNFNTVVMSPPYMWRDFTVTVLGVLVAIAGWSFQHWHNIGRPPFPPPPRSTRAAPDHGFMYGALTDESTQPIRGTAMPRPNAPPQPTEQTRLLVH